MNTPFIRRLQGIFVAVVVLAVGAAGTATASVAAPLAQASGLTAGQKKAKARELNKCRKQRNAGKRKACIRKVNRKYAALAAPKGKTYVVDVGKGGNFYVPSLVKLKVNDSIEWDWRYSVAAEGHNVSLMSGPAGVSRFQFESSIMSDPDATFKRQFKKPGNYNLFCTLHAGMTMDVQVRR